MMHRRLTALVFAVLLASCSSPATVGTAEGAKPAEAPRTDRGDRSDLARPPTRDALTIIHEDTDGRRSPLLDPRGMTIYDDLGHGLQPEITIEPADELGYDIVLDFENTRSTPVGLGTITVGVITLGPDISWLNLNRHSSFVSQSRRDFSAQNRAYPGSWYSPVGVLHNDRFAVGVSLLYDLLQDRHSVRVAMNKPGGIFSNGPGGAGYSIGFHLGNPKRGGGRVAHPAELLPGERRTYRVAVRAVKLDRPVTTSGEQQWLGAIEPYREHFTSLYGGVTYQRDARPVRGGSLSGGAAIRPDNPMGYKFGRNHRPDLVGWGAAMNHTTRPTGYDRVMLWNVGGLYMNNKQLNFPSRFMSQLVTSPQLATAFDERVGLPRIPAAGQQLGLWWGRASRVARRWDSPNWEPLDLNYPDRVALALHEMQLADRAGATLIGLDAFIPTDMPVWQQYEWIVQLRRLYPDTKYVVEPFACDVLHTLGPTFILAWQGGDRTGRPETRFRVHHANYMADYLIPGHETWGYFRYDGTTVPENAARVQQDGEYIAATGHVAVLKTGESLLDSSRALAAPTWLRTVPDELKTAAHQTATPPVVPIPGQSEPPAENRSGGGDSDDGSSDGDNGRDGNGDEGDSFGGGDDGDTKGGHSDPEGPRFASTRPFMLPNGRVIRLPMYDRSGR